MIEKRHNDRKVYLERPTRVKKALYEQSRSESNIVLRRKKREYMNRKLLFEIEENLRDNNLKGANREINKFKKGYVSKDTLCRE